MRLSVKEFEGKRFHFLDFGSGYHGRKNFRLWVNRQLVRHDEDGEPIIEFPVRDAQVLRTEKGSLVLKPSEGVTTFDLFVKCGYRGSASIEVLEPAPLVELDYVVYESPAGSLGVSVGKLVCVRGEKVKYRWERTGRLYGAPGEGISVVYADGRTEVLDGLLDGVEELEEALT